MQPVIEAIKELFKGYSAQVITNITKIPQSGSNRIYYRLLAGKDSYIATHNENTQENNTFIQFSTHFRSKGCPVPNIFAVNKELTIYIQEDFGDLSLSTMLEEQGQTDIVYKLFQKSLKSLAHLQITGHQGLDYSLCITSSEFGKQAIFSDLLYFKYYFLDTLQIPYDKEKLLDEFESLGSYLTQVDHKYFMFRDFQSRNIMVKNGHVHFIDFQGGMQGALQYDPASLLWQAKAGLTDKWKNELLLFYMDCVEEILQKKIDRGRFVGQYNGYVLIRLLQVLGAYGFRGLFERKAHFLISIPLGLKNLKWFLANKEIDLALPEFQRLLHKISGDDIIHRFIPPRADDDTPLVVAINSFSFKKGIPSDLNGNGGGFVFDCRGILNPGRIDRFKHQTGRDKAVKEYLEGETKMPSFLAGVYNLIDISIEDYMQRNFNHLMISFGCTGGQHRSVYAADALVRHLKNKYNVRTVLCHLEQETKNWMNE